MKPLIINPIYTNPVMDLGAEELRNIFMLYSHTHNNLSEESLGKLTSNIAISFADFIVRIGKNIKENVTGIFKDFKRSTLKIVVDSHKFALNRIYQSNYSDICQFEYQQYPFTVHPKEVMKFFDEQFITFDMVKRMESLIHEYLLFAAYIDSNDMNSAEAVIRRIKLMNLTSYKFVTTHLLRIVAPPDGKKVTFGKVFNSVTEFREIIDLTLVHANELDKATSVGKYLDNLYDAFAKIQKSILKAKEKNIDFHRIIDVSVIINDTGTFIEQYAMLVKEYHHLEYWLANVIEDTVKLIKK